MEKDFVMTLSEVFSEWERIRKETIDGVSSLGQTELDMESIKNELYTSHQYVIEGIANSDTGQWDEKIYSPRPGEMLSLKDIAWHTIEHEMRHHGQIFMLMRLQGIKPPNV
jgi:uncharacterized damage-inducible protein DinB